MAKKGNVATITIEGVRYSIESDAIVDIETTMGVTYKKGRVVGLSRMGTELRVVFSEGVNEIPIKNIKTIKDSENNTMFPGVKKV